ncbi:MAG: glycosyltransferase family 4 protein [Candidatus Lindowbacteria bacterium]|nr:glycosyltransferase family 4 protein [Candidatus Lindowbacteria bacterium]
MKVPQVLRRFSFSEWGGTETVVWNTTKEMRRQGFSSEILCTSARETPNIEFRDGIEIRRFEYFYPYFGLNDGARNKLDKKGGDPFSPLLKHHLQCEDDLSLIHCHTMRRIGGIVRRVAYEKKVPYVISLHGGHFDVPHSEIEDMILPTRKAFNYGRVFDFFHGTDMYINDAAGIVCVGENECVKAKEYYPHKLIRHIPNGVDVCKYDHGNKERFRKKYNLPSNARILLSVGRIDPQKNQQLLVELLNTMKQKDLFLVLIGPITSKTYLTSLNESIRRYGLENRVLVLGGLPPDAEDLLDAFAAAEIFLLASVHEPFGIVVLEAWAASTPVIATNVGGLRTLIDEEETGLKFEVSNLEGLLRQTRRLLSNDTFKRSLAQKGKQKAQTQYSWKAVTDQLIDFYEEVRGQAR